MRHNHGIEALQRAVLTTPGDAHLALRRQVFDGEEVGEPLGSYLGKVATEAYRR